LSDLCLTDLHSIFVVDIQHLDGDHPSQRNANQDRTVPPKMDSPQLPARIVKGDDSPSQHSRQIRSLRSIAFRARKTEIGKAIGTSMLLRNDVFDMKGEVVVILLPVTVLAPPVRSQNDEPTSLGVHEFVLDWARSRRERDFK